MIAIDLTTQIPIKKRGLGSSKASRRVAYARTECADMSMFSQLFYFIIRYMRFLTADCLGLASLCRNYRLSRMYNPVCKYVATVSMLCQRASFKSGYIKMTCLTVALAFERYSSYGKIFHNSICDPHSLLLFRCVRHGSVG